MQREGGRRGQARRPASAKNNETTSLFSFGAREKAMDERKKDSSPGFSFSLPRFIPIPKNKTSATLAFTVRWNRGEAGTKQKL